MEIRVSLCPQGWVTQIKINRIENEMNKRGK